MHTSGRKSSDRDLRDVLHMQDEIAANIVRALQVEVYGLSARPALRSTEGYNLFCRGFNAAQSLLTSKASSRP